MADILLIKDTKHVYALFDESTIRKLIITANRDLYIFKALKVFTYCGHIGFSFVWPEMYANMILYVG